MKNILASRLTGRVLSAAMGVGLLGVLIMGSAGTALAAGGGGSTTTTITGAGAPTVAPMSALEAVYISDPTLNLNGTTQTVNIAIPLHITDATGILNGWALAVQADQFAAGNSTYQTYQILPTNALSFSSLQTTASDKAYDNTTTLGCDSTSSDCSLPVTNQVTPSIGTLNSSSWSRSTYGRYCC